MNNAARRLISIILTVLMTVPFAGLVSGCSAFEFFRSSVIDTSTNTISEQEIARLLIAAINDETEVASSYSQIPDRQMDGISYSAFNEYVSILRSVSDGFGPVKSFRILSNSDSSKYLKGLLDKTDMDSISDRYGHLSVVQLEYDISEKGNNNSTKFCISLDNDDVAYLSRAYVTETIAAYNYLEHYFTMLEENNTDGLFALLSPLYDSDIYINSVINAKAEYIAEYYLVKVITSKDDFIFDTVVPYYVHVTIPRVVDEDDESITEHYVELTLNSDGYYDITDVIPWYIENNSIGIYDNENNAIRLFGITLNRDKLVTLLGEPYYFREYPSEDTGEEADPDAVTIRAFYPGIVVSVDGHSSGDGTWEGSVSGISIYSEDYSIDGQISCGMNMSELLIIYPMIDEEDFSFTFLSARDEYSVSFKFDSNNNISAINLQREKSE